MSPPSTLLLIGSGPGIGLATATLFASKKFSKIALLSRNTTRLSTDRDTLLSSLPASRKSEVEVKTWAVDVTESKTFKGVLEEVGEWAVEGVDCVVFNAARVEPSKVLEFEGEEVVRDFMVGGSFSNFGPVRSS